MNRSARRAHTDLWQIRLRLLAMALALDARHEDPDVTESRTCEEVLDDVDRAQCVSEGRFTQALELALVESRNQIVHALDVLETGGYGVCEDCGVPISKARMAFRPESTKCLPCQRAADHESG
jgi:DnaK suppressor protein